MRKPSFTLLSPETGTEYRLHVRKPRGPGPWTAMLFLDGDDMFTHAVKAREALSSGPPLLIVGVGYGASFTKPGNKRARDYTPMRAHEEASSGGADRFLAFLTDTLWPELQRRYPIRDDQRGLGGYSLGALLVLHAQFQPKPFFTHHLAGSPSIWWGDAAILARVAEMHVAHPDLPGKLFLSVGRKDSKSMTGDLARLETQLAAANFPNLDVSVRRFPGKNHFNAMPVTFEAGLEDLVGRPARRLSRD
jgi:predicted alpha/beta superfamily hydrolase